MADTPDAPETPTPDAPHPLLPENQAARVRQSARRLIGNGVSTGAFLVAGAALLHEGFRTGSSRDYLFALLIGAFGVAKAIASWIRYRQLCRYLRTGSGSKYEDLVKAAEFGRKPGR
jgi:hypothetical protein